MKRSVAALRKATPNLLGAVLNAVDVKAQELPVLLLPGRGRGEGRRGEGRGRARGSGQGLTVRPGASVLARSVVVLAVGLAGVPPALVGALTPSPLAAKPPRPAVAGVAVATLSWKDEGVEREDALGKTGWHAMKPGESVKTGDRLRTAPEGIARFDLPWMSVTAGPATVMYIPAEVVLSLVLLEGRAEFEAHGRDIVKVRTAEAVIRGVGAHRGAPLERPDPRHGDGDGRDVRVEASGETVVLAAGEGTVVRDGEAPRPAQALPDRSEGAPPGRRPALRPERPAGRPQLELVRPFRTRPGDGHGLGRGADRPRRQAICRTRSSFPGRARTAGASPRATPRASRAGPRKRA